MLQEGGANVLGAGGNADVTRCSCGTNLAADAVFLEGRVIGIHQTFEHHVPLIDG